MMRSVLALTLCLVGCGNEQPPAMPATSSSAPPAAPAETTAAPAAPAEPAPEPKKRKPYEISSNCNDVVSIAFGEDGKSGSKRTLAPGSTIEGPRDNDGNQTIWLLDTKGEPLVKVRVTRGMSRVEIGKSCRTIDAR
jgi:hypothetical protein